MRELTPERETRLIAAGRGRLSRAFPAPLPACDAKGPLFRTIGPGTGPLTRTVLPQTNAYAMIRRRAAAAGIATKLGNHSSRATAVAAPCPD